MARNQKVVPESHQALDALKYEIAAELGLPVGKNKPGFYGNADAEFASELGSVSLSSTKEDYWGHITSRDAGAVGGTITQRLIRKAEETLFTL
ncbi:alpha/beta-type small acid-soluble spore protein [Paenibacillus larvae]|uniref:Small, acid-soluble spore protein A n=3 Tax=Paenibacillus larvae TaxID=1464 RepID=V9VZ76_9BACL|nr:alpha/beta-type small acid-soluble spore protein [Paenibacillus larvae]AHD03966.1 small, acid-soluble spore protein A [Paenibacillus larvae subsp. larvae DSM 25430]AQR78637.1 spore protein [Paenibacillus larvae subsp. larvae]AVF20105.1 small, acid-soluble spore protein A [Paenibacillus larvae subsp. larvae]AVG10572.1 small, acid-soluble spore protein A [Paenibacillus larvae subsp. larvae DSM 25430]ETK29193.1 small, acid-soluble spore protein A [Paenibacillus larvae subsp. larvae DSM 25719]